MVEVKTKSGFACKIDEEALNDWELLEGFREVDKGNASAIVDIAPRLLGEDAFKELKEHVRTDKGRIPVDAMINEISEIMSGANAGKNF